jgi:phosphatidylserine decarboxylase
MKLTPYGRKEWLGSALMALILSAGWTALALRGHPVTGGTLLALTWLLWLAIAAFFRVPCRTIKQDPSQLLSPADGRVSDIETITDHGILPFAGTPLTRIGIFLSVLDVHVNRAPCNLTVEYRNYKEGRFLDARDSRCAKENESLVIAGTGTAGKRTFPVAVRQISGAIARRIVCEPQPGTTLHQGDIYGMIKFGSRTELYFPAGKGITPCVQVGDRVRSGLSYLARIEQP